MSGLILLMGVLLFWSHSATQHEFATAIDQSQRGDINCTIHEGRGVTPPKTSTYAADQGSDLVNFDSFIECRRNFLPARAGNQEQTKFLANLDELSMQIAKRLADQPQKLWHLQPVFRSKVLGEKVFSTVAFRLKNAGLNVSNLILDEPELCPDRSENLGLLALIYDDEQQKLNVGLCEGDHIQWWFHETR
jgi:hypothetical protein